METREKVPREFYSRKGDAEKHGYTRGCGGCSSWHRGLARQPHSEKCRERFCELLREEARVKNAEVRRKEFETKQLEKQAAHPRSHTQAPNSILSKQRRL